MWGGGAGGGWVGGGAGRWEGAEGVGGVRAGVWWGVP